MNLLKYVLTAGGIASALAGYSADSNAQMRLWGTYYGGSSIETAEKVATDASGNVYVVGTTGSTDGIVTPNSFDSIKQKKLLYSGYLAKFDTNGALVWATYYGNDATKLARLVDLGLDANGNVYVLGEAECPLPGLATGSAHQGQCLGTTDIYLAKFDSHGTRLWATYFGGEGGESAGGLSVTPAGKVYLIGSTSSTQGIASAESKDKTLDGTLDAVIAKFNTYGALSWSRYFGGGQYETGADITCRAFTVYVTEMCFITGQTRSGTGIAVGNAHDIKLDGINDAFVAKLFGTTGATAWSTYYGGSSQDIGHAIVVDKDLNAYVGGTTLSSNLPATPGAHDSEYADLFGYYPDAFLAKFNVDGVRKAATYFGNEKQDSVLDLALDANNRLYLLGDMHKDATSPGPAPATPAAYDTSLGGEEDAVVAKFDSTLGLIWATYYGGSSLEMNFNSRGSIDAGGIAIGKDNHFYVAGATYSNDSIATPGSHQTVRQDLDAFLAEFVE